MTPTPVLPSLTDQEITIAAMSAGFMLSTAHGQSTHKMMPVSDRATLIAFARAIESLSRAPAEPLCPYYIDGPFNDGTHAVAETSTGRIIRIFRDADDIKLAAGTRIVTAPAFGIIGEVTAIAAHPTESAGPAPAGMLLVSEAALRQIARAIEGLKRECGMDPESPQAIRNAQYMSLAYAVRKLGESHE